MAITVSKKPKESVGAMLRRFAQVVRKSGIINQYKERKFRPKSKSRNLARRSALVRLKRKGKYEYLKKIGAIS